MKLSPAMYAISCFAMVPFSAMLLVAFAAILLILWPVLPFLCYFQRREEILIESNSDNQQTTNTQKS